MFNQKSFDKIKGLILNKSSKSAKYQLKASF